MLQLVLLALCVFLAWNSSASNINVWESIYDSSFVPDTEFHAQVCLNDSMFVFGGFDAFANSMNNTAQYLFSSNSWKVLDGQDVSPANRSCAASTHIESATAAFIHGGISTLSNGSYTLLNDSWIFSPQHNNWTYVTDGPTCWGCSAVELNGSVYVFGGITGKDVNLQWQHSNTLHVLDLGNQTWSEVTVNSSSGSPSNRSFASLFMVDEKIYVVGGCGSVLNNTFHLSCNTTASDVVWKIDLGVDSSFEWTFVLNDTMGPVGMNSLAPIDGDPTSFLAYFPFASNSSTTFIFNSSTSDWIAVHQLSFTAIPSPRFGGQICMSDPGVYLLFGGFIDLFYQDTWSFDLTGRVWLPISLNTYPVSRAYSSMEVVNDTHVIILGGFNGNELMDLWIWGNSADNKFQVPNLDDNWPSARYAAATVMSGGNLYLFGGRNIEISPLSDAWMFNLTSLTWQQLNPTNGPGARFGHSLALISPTEALLFGGVENIATNLGDTWIWNLTENTSWTQLNTPGPNSCSFFSMTTVNDSVVLFGGIIESTRQPLSQLWKFDISSQTWSNINVVGGVVPLARGFHAATTLSCSTLVIAGGYTGQTSPSSDEVFIGTFTDSSSTSWEWQLLQTSEMEGRYSLNAGILGQIDDICFHPSNVSNSSSANFFVLFGYRAPGSFVTENILQAVALGCNPGFYSDSFGSGLCQSCGIGSFSDLFGSTSCTSCNPGVTTNGTASIAQNNCSICQPDYCSHGGSCEVLTGSFTPTCSCQFFFEDENRCNTPSLIGYVIIASASLGAFVIIAILVNYKLRRRHKEESERLVRKHQEESESLRRRHQEESEVAEKKVSYLTIAFKKSVYIDPASIAINTSEVLGRGSYGIVYLAAMNNARLAAKSLRRPASYEETPFISNTADHDNKDLRAPLLSSMKASSVESERVLSKSAEDEIMKLVQLKHKNIVHIFGVVTQQGMPYIIMEYCQRGSLHAVLRSNLDLTLPFRVKMLREIASGMHFLHQNHIAHGDIKSANILIDDNFTAKISDLGSAQRIQPEKLRYPSSSSSSSSTDSQVAFRTAKGHRIIGTLRWAAPEVLHKFELTVRSDVYSFGIVMWEVFTREVPYSHLDLPKDTLRGRIILHNYRPLTDGKDFPETYMALMKACWDGNAHQRPKSEDVKKQLGEYLDGLKLMLGEIHRPKDPQEEENVSIRENLMSPVPQSNQQYSMNMDASDIESEVW